MGSSMKKLSSYFSKQDESRIVMCGLDAAGKTTILYISKLGEIVTTIPTIGFNVETLTFGNLSITVWDVGGRDKIRPLWRHYFQNTSAFVFVVDSNDRERIGEAREELHRMANEEQLKGVPFLIFANKQDLPNVLTVDEIVEQLQLAKFTEKNVKWHIQSAVATENKGLNEGFKWIADSLQPKTDLLKPIIETINDSNTMKKDLFSAWNSIDLKTFLSKFI